MDIKLFQQRRSQLMQRVQDDTVVIIPAATMLSRNGDVEYLFRQDSTFHYLTGYPEADAIAVLIPDGSAVGAHKALLFNLKQDPKVERWVGKRYGQEDACEQFLFDAAYPIEEFEEKIVSLATGFQNILYPFNHSMSFEIKMNRLVESINHCTRAGVNPPSKKVDLQSIVSEMRLVKSSEEIQHMRTAAQISAKAQVRAMQACQPGMMEYQIEAELMHAFLASGCRHAAYQAIVAGGENACTLHYTRNDAVLNEGELLLIDAGGEFEYYAADITRTFPINGKFTEQQQAVYEIVLAAQQAAIAEVKPGNRWNQPHEAATQVLTRGLVELGILSGDVSGLIEQKKQEVYFPHRTGHWLGMDVHDVGQYKVGEQWRAFEPGMVLTVEPGLYFSRELAVDKKWHSIGVRIEDDVLVTDNGNEVLSGDAPKAVNEIERIMQG